MRHKLNLTKALALMKRGLASVAMLGMLIVPAIAAEKEIFKVGISPAVQEQIQKVSPDERKQLETAISAGNKFIPYHYDGRAYDVGDSGIKEEWEFWLKNIRPLINKEVREWYITELFPPSSGDLSIKGTPDKPAAVFVTVCPKIELVSIAATGDYSDGGWKKWFPKRLAEDSFVLEYRAKIIGATESKGIAPRFFLPNKYDEFETVLISLDKNNKVSQVAAPNTRWPWTAEREIGILTLYISGVWSGGITADEKARLEQMIQQIKYEKNRVCKDVSATTNQPSIKG